VDADGERHGLNLSGNNALLRGRRNGNDDERMQTIHGGESLSRYRRRLIYIAMQGVAFYESAKAAPWMGYGV
jgi:hypothetical protein